MMEVSLPLFKIATLALMCDYFLFIAESIALQNHPVVSYNGSRLLFHLDDVECRGDENLLSDCPHDGIGVPDCSVRDEEAGVICSSKLF